MKNITNNIFISIGTNLGDRENNLKSCIESIKANNKIQDNFLSSVRTESAVRETEKKIESLFNLHNK